jgi:hypothetical protein
MGESCRLNELSGWNSVPPNKELKLTKPGQNEAPQLNSSVRPTAGWNPRFAVASAGEVPVFDEPPWSDAPACKMSKRT